MQRQDTAQRLGIDVTRFIVGGGSAGANLVGQEHITIVLEWA